MYQEFKRYKIKSSHWKKILDLDDPHTQEIFYHFSNDQVKFQIELNKFRLEVEGSEMIKTVGAINTEFEKLENAYPELYNSKKRKVRGRLDFDIAEIYHRNLRFPKRSLNDYRLWRYITLNYFIEHVHWRWRSDKAEEFSTTAKSIYDHSIAPEYPKRINALRYWIIGERLHDRQFEYRCLRSLADRARNCETGGFQDYINNIVDNQLLSPNELVSKKIGLLMLNRDEPLGVKEVVAGFKRYNAFKLRDYRYTNDEILEKEICQIH